jgi:hypothetical protein
MHPPPVFSSRHFPALAAWRWLTLLVLCSLGNLSAMAAEVTRLSLVKDAEFPGWLVGTEWEYTPKQGKRRLWFAAPGVVIYSRPGETGTKSQSGYSYTIQKKGIVRTFAANSATSPIDLTVAEDLKQGSVYSAQQKERSAATMIGRRFLPSPADMKEAEFKAWLKGKTVSFEGGSSKTFGDSTVETRTSRESRTWKLHFVRPGLVYYLWNESPNDPTLISFSEDLKSARFWCWWGTNSGSVSGGAPPAAAAKATRTTSKSSVVTMNDLKAIPLTNRAAAVNALLIQELGNSRYAGKASSLSLSALPLEGDKPATVAFNQAVGSMMSKALQEVARFHAIRHGGWPRAHEVQLSFEDKFGGKDGPSAAVACALLLESAIKGTALDPAFAVTGDMNADGSVQPIGGVHAKLRGATNLKCKLLGIPSKNVIHATDLVLTEGLKPFLGIQVFSLAKFDDALSVARADKSADLAAAITDFAAFAKTAGPNPQSLRAPDAVARLRSILQRAPGHLSAAVLLQFATDKLPKSLSPAGTLSELDQSIGDLNTAIDGDLNATNKLDSGQIAKARSGFQRLRPLADSRVRPLVDAWVNWGNVADKLARAGGTLNEKSFQEYRAAISRIQVEDEKLRSNESFREALK